MSGAEVQVDPAVLEFELVDLAFAVLLAPAVLLALGLEGQHLKVAGRVRQFGE